MVILAGHPHMLMYKSFSGRGMPEYSFFQGQSEKVMNVSPGSVTFQYPPDFCIATKIHEGKGTINGRETKRNYASGIHPVTIAQIMEMFPHLVEKQEGELSYDAYEEQVFIPVIFSLKGQPDVILENLRVPASPEQTKEFLARMPEHIPERTRDASSLIYQETPRTPEELQRLGVLKDKMEENNDRIEVFFKRAFELTERHSLLAPFDYYEISSLQSEQRSITSGMSHHWNTVESMVHRADAFFFELERYEHALQDFEAKNGSTNNAIAQALQKARGETVQTEKDPVFTQKQSFDDANNLPKKKREKVSETISHSSLSEDILIKIDALVDPEERALLIMEEQQEIRKKLNALEGESQELVELVASADELSEEHKRWKKEEHALDKEIKALTQRKEDKQKEASLRLRRREMADAIRKIEEKLKSARSAKSKAADFVKAKNLLEAQLQELAKMEEDALKNV
jgi:DNA repair exonuclease SbcCD ATPase subunit